MFKPIINNYIDECKVIGEYAEVNISRYTEKFNLYVKLSFSNFIEELIEAMNNGSGKCGISTFFTSEKWTIVVTDNIKNIRGDFHHEVIEMKKKSNLIENYFN